MIQKLYRQFLDVTGDPGAAALLTLAQVIEQKPQRVALTVKEAAASLGVSKNTIYRLCEEGLLRHQKLGRTVRIQPDDLQTIKMQKSSGGKHKFQNLAI